MNKLNILLIVFFLSSISVSFAQETNKLSSFLTERVSDKETTEELTVWIYFTDKGADLNQKIATTQQTLGERSLERRKRSIKNRPLVTFYDVPVLQEYVEQVTPFVTKIRHHSKWLNAVSAKVNKTKLPEIAELDCVKTIDIVRHGKRDSESMTNNKTSNKKIAKKSAVYDLDYGESLTQLEQIDVPLVHDLGYSGEGMIICVLDAGFRFIDTHPVFSTIDIMDAYDFVNDDDNVDNEIDDMGNGSHGTSTLSTIGGFSEGNLIGPAYNATYLLAKTENTDSELPVEEDNWVAAVEWAEGLGADITSTSLSYLGYDDGSGWGPADMDGNTAPITIAGDIMASLGVLVVNSAGNAGGGTTTIGAPADGNEILAIGAVNADGNKAGFSSVGPTADDRIKPDVMAMGVSVVVASGNSNFSNSNGTSFSCPLVAGAAALLWEMVPTATNMEIFEALKMSADNAATPNNDYGWGIINLYAAFEYLTGADTEIPNALCQNATIELGIDGMGSLETSDIDAGSSDNVAIASYTLDNNTFSCDEVGDNNVTLTVTDPAGNENSCIAVVTVVDVTNPLPDAGGLVLPAISADCEVSSLTAPTATDNCAGVVVATHDAILPITTTGTTEVTWTYTDNSGNVSFQFQDVNINDVTNPTVLTQDITVDLNGAASISILPSDVDAGSSDNCGNVGLTLDEDTFRAFVFFLLIFIA